MSEPNSDQELSEDQVLWRNCVEQVEAVFADAKYERTDRLYVAAAKQLGGLLLVHLVLIGKTPTLPAMHDLLVSEGPTLDSLEDADGVYAAQFKNWKRVTAKLPRAAKTIEVTLHSALANHLHLN